MYYLYILENEKIRRHYIGTTENVELRIAKHNKGDVRSTKAYRPWKVAHIEKFTDKTEARKREIFLKKNAKARSELYNEISKNSYL